MQGLYFCNARLNYDAAQGYPSGVIFALVLWSHLQKKNSPQTSRNCGQKEEQPWASPYSWHLKGCSSVWNLVLRFLFTIEYDIWCRAVLLFAQVPWIGTEILLLVTTISGLFFFLRWDQSTSAKMIPLVLPDGCSSIFLGRNHKFGGPSMEMSYRATASLPPSLARPCNFCSCPTRAQLLFLIKSCFLAAASSARSPPTTTDAPRSWAGEGGQLIQQAFEAHGGHFAKWIASPSLWKIIRKCIAIPSKHGGLWSFVALTG